MSPVRPLREADLEQLIELHELVWPARGDPRSGLEQYLRRLLVESPFAHPDFPSLVFEREGRVLAFVGSLWRPMLFRDEPLDMVVTHTLMAHPERRSASAGVELLRRVFGGRQQLSIAQGNDLSAKLWTAVGGESSPLLGLHWIRVLRPFGYLETWLKRGGRPVLGHLMAPVRALLDPVLTRAGAFPLSHERPVGVTAAEASPRELLAVSSRSHAGRALVPGYDVETFSWILEALRYRRSRGELRALVLSEGSAEPFGWLLYHESPGSVAQVVSVGAVPEKVGPVLEHLFWDAHERGAHALAGLADPRSLREYSARHCYFGNDASWFLIHAKGPVLRAALHRGDCLISRMEGEWWIGFEPEVTRA